MAAEITLFNLVGSSGDYKTQVPWGPFASETATFTPARDCVARVYANGADVSLTIQTITFTVPSGTVESIGLRAADGQVTVA